MSASGYNVRRATTDDLWQLAALWTASALPAEELEKRFTEFQVAEGDGGVIVGAIGLQVAESDGLVHSETFADFALSDTLRPLLWKRLETAARHRGLFRLWTVETAPFWKKDAGFSTVPGQPPEAFGQSPGPWLVLRLRDESADPNLIDAQFKMFKLFLDAEKARREKLLRFASAMKTSGTVIALILFVFAMVVLFWFFRHRAR